MLTWRTWPAGRETVTIRWPAASCASLTLGSPLGTPLRCRATDCQAPSSAAPVSSSAAGGKKLALRTVGAVGPLLIGSNATATSVDIGSGSQSTTYGAGVPSASNGAGPALGGTTSSRSAIWSNLPGSGAPLVSNTP